MYGHLRQRGRGRGCRWGMLSPSLSPVKKAATGLQEASNSSGRTDRRRRVWGGGARGDPYPRETPAPLQKWFSPTTFHS